jgi:hypothetical protein
MRHPFSLSSVILSFAAFAAPACLAAPAPASVANPAACPVELSAEQRGMGALVAVGPDSPAVPPDANHPRQSIDLSMKNIRLQRIVAAELEVHGTSNKSRVLPAGGAVLTNQPTADAVRNVHLVSSVPAEQSRTRTLSVNDLTSVAYILVIELRYADGSTWHARPGAECRVIPDGMMLIAGK